MNGISKLNYEAWNAIAKMHHENYHVGRLLTGKGLIVIL